MIDLVHTLISVAAVFWLALLIGRQVFRLHLPRVTGYLLAGILAGPSLSTWLGYPALLDQTDLARLPVLSDIALALIMLTIGMHFRSEHLHRWRHRIAVLSLCEIGATLVLVSTATALVNFLVVRKIVTSDGDLLQSSLYIGLFLGIIAIATAPAATLLVIREYGSEGPVTDSAVTLIGLNNLFAILAFNVAYHFTLVQEGQLLALLARLALPLAIGAAAGFAMSIWAERLESTTENQLLVLGGAIGGAGICRLLEVDALLGCFTCGTVLANASIKERDLLDSLRRLDYPLYMMFFVLAGAGLHLDLLAHIGLIGAAYVAMRTLGKLLGCYLGTRLGRFGDRHQRWTGPVMLAQAGVAIGMSSFLSRTWPAGGEMLQTVVLGAVVIFELGGPVTVRIGLVRAGEVPILTLLARKAPVGSFESIHHVVDHFRDSLGIPHGHNVEDAGDILVEHVMRKNVDSIPENTPFNELLRLIAHSRYDRFPVVDAQNRFEGIIVYADIRDILFDPILSRLIIAIDLAKPEHLSVHPRQTLREVLHLFQEHPDISYLPVLDDEEPDRLLGILNQNDVLSTFHRLG